MSYAALLLWLLAVSVSEKKLFVCCWKRWILSFSGRRDLQQQHDKDRECVLFGGR